MYSCNTIVYLHIYRVLVYIPFTVPILFFAFATWARRTISRHGQRKLETNHDTQLLSEQQDKTTSGVTSENQSQGFGTLQHGVILWETAAHRNMAFTSGKQQQPGQYLTNSHAHGCFVVDTPLGEYLRE